MYRYMPLFVMASSQCCPHCPIGGYRSEWCYLFGSDSSQFSVYRESRRSNHIKCYIPIHKTHSNTHLNTHRIHTRVHSSNTWKNRLKHWKFVQFCYRKSYITWITAICTKLGGWIGSDLGTRELCTQGGSHRHRFHCLGHMTRSRRSGHTIDCSFAR